MRWHYNFKCKGTLIKTTHTQHHRTEVKLNESLSQYWKGEIKYQKEIEIWMIINLKWGLTLNGEIYSNDKVHLAL